jgi:NTP pyrophosphatase (non-canonical NTP hydrolase)
MNWEKIYNEIRDERCRQDVKWGEQNHTPIEWCAILGEEVGEVQKAALENHFSRIKEGSITYYLETGLENYRSELIQVAAVVVSMIQCLDRNK